MYSRGIGLVLGKFVEQIIQVERGFENRELHLQAEGGLHHCVRRMRNRSALGIRHSVLVDCSKNVGGAL